jgi:hypothetical protein
MLDTSTPFSMRALVMLRSEGSKSSAFADMVLAARNKNAMLAENLIVGIEVGAFRVIGRANRGGNRDEEAVIATSQVFSVMACRNSKH